jgi:hypothetical protein
MPTVIDPTAPFRSKDFLSLIDGMILTARAHTERVTDYNAGSVARTLLEAPGLEVDALYQAMVLNLLDAIPVAIYQGFSFTALPAMAAAGFVVFTLAAPVLTVTTIPAGTVLRAPGLLTSYQTQADGVIAIGATTVTVAIACTETGAIGNALTNTVIASEAAINDLTLTNPEPISGGRGMETADERRLRFIRYIQSLARGTVASLYYIARMGQVTALNGLVMERAERVAIEETPGHVNCWVYNGRGNTSAALLADISGEIEGYWDELTQQFIPGYRPAGMRVDVHAMIEQPVNVQMELDVAATYRTSTLVTQASDAIKATILLEEALGLLRPAELINSVLLLPHIDGARLIAPTQSLPVAANRALVPGVITITWNPES